MARSLNKVMLIGNVGQDPEIRFTKEGKAVANMSLATSESWNDKQGQAQDRTEWHRVVVFGNLAEIVQQYVNKGDKLYMEGKIQTRKWTDKDGHDRYTTEIVVDGFGGQMIMLGGQGRGSQQSGPDSHNESKSNGYQPEQKPRQQPARQEATQAPDFDDNIPF